MQKCFGRMDAKRLNITREVPLRLIIIIAVLLPLSLLPSGLYYYRHSYSYSEWQEQGGNADQVLWWRGAVLFTWPAGHSGRRTQGLPHGQPHWRRNYWKWLHQSQAVHKEGVPELLRYRHQPRHQNTRQSWRHYTARGQDRIVQRTSKSTGNVLSNNADSALLKALL